MKPLLALSAVLLGATVSTNVQAQAYPTKTVRMIVPFAPGGGTDFIGRIAAQKLGDGLKQTFIVDNRPGAGSTLGTELGTKAPPDGYTLTVIAGSYGVNPSLYKLGFDPINDITPIVQFSQGPFLVVVTPSLPAKSIKELIALGKTRSGGLNFASSGAGSIVHVSAEYFLSMAGVKAVHIPHRGTGPAITDTMAGNTQFLFGSMGAVMPQVKAGKLRGIAVTSAKRLPTLPDTPTVAETLKGYEALNWHGLVGPKGLPQPIVTILNTEVNKFIKAKDMEDKLAADGVFAAGGTPAEFHAFIKREIERWTKVVKATGVKASD